MITKTLEKSFDFEGVRVELCIPFNHILLFYELQKDEMFSEIEKIDLGFDLLCRVKSKKKHISPQMKVNIIKYIFDNYVHIGKKTNSDNDGPKAFDFIQDSEYIFASFMSEYGIDLSEQIDKLDWRKFISLFNGLSDDSKIKQVIKIRTMKLPKPNKQNADHIRSIMEAKAYYALELSEEERKQQFANSLKKIAKRIIK